MLNKVILIGRLTRDPELKYTQTGTAVTGFTVAVDRPFANQKGQREADFIRIVTWQKLAEICANYLGKGRLVAVDGRLQVRSYDTQEGQRRQTAEVVAETVRFLDRAREPGQAAQEDAAAAASDLLGTEVPFNEEDFQNAQGDVQQTLEETGGV